MDYKVYLIEKNHSMCNGTLVDIWNSKEMKYQLPVAGQSLWYKNNYYKISDVIQHYDEETNELIYIVILNECYGQTDCVKKILENIKNGNLKQHLIM